MAVPISNVTRRVVFAPSGTGPYAFTFEILAATDIEVYKGDTKLTLTTDYTVTINSNGTGSVTLVATAGTDNITIVGARTIQRTTDFVTGGDLFANSLNDELDSLTIFTQQNAEAGDRSIKAPVTDPTTIDMTLPVKADRAGKYLSFNSSTGNPEVVNNVVDVTAVASNAANINAVAGQITPVNNVSTVAGQVANISAVAGSIASVVTVAGIAANVTTVAGISADVTAVAGDATDIGTVAGLSTEIAALGPIAADITTVAGIDSDVTAVAADATDIGTVAANIADVSTVAGISADVTTVAADGADIGAVAAIDSDVTAVAGIAANVTTVAGIAANVTTVAGISADVTTVAANVTDITNFSDVYLGPKSSDPSVRNDSSALQAGDLYFDTVADAMKVYDGANWVAAYISGTGFVDLSSAQTVTGIKTFDNGLKTDTISEETAAAGVTVDGVLLKDNQVSTDQINEKTSAAGVTIDGVLLKDSEVTTDVIKEKTSAAGVTIDGVLLKDTTVTANSIKASGTSSSEGRVELYEDTDNGTNYVAIKAPATIASNVTWTLPATDGTSGQALTTNGSGGLSFATVGASSNVQTFDTSGTWTKPASGSMARVQIWGAGGGGGRNTSTSAAGGGGGGGYNELTVPVSYLNSSVSITIGAGGAGRTGSAGTGTAGGATSVPFASYPGGATTFYAYGGGAGGTDAAPLGAGGGGGLLSAGSNNTPTNGLPWGVAANTALTDGGINLDYFWCGGRGGANQTNINNVRGYVTVWGGAGGGGTAGTGNITGANSVYGGNGGDGGRVTSGFDGIAPAGGGGGRNNNLDGGNGAAGRVIITVW